MAELTSRPLLIQKRVCRGWVRELEGLVVSKIIEKLTNLLQFLKPVELYFT